MLFLEPLERRDLLTAGLGVTYYDNANFTGKTVQRIDQTINFNWGAGGPSSKISSDTFSAVWVGMIQPKYSQTYSFYSTTDDGVQLFINGKTIINFWADRPAKTSTGSIALQAGVKYSIKMNYYDNTGGASAKLEWSSASQARQIVPASALSTVQIYPGDQWLDTSGKPIQAHGGGILYRGGVYYWYGEDRSGATFVNSKGNTGTPLVGVNCYASTDLINWEFRGTVLPAVKNDPNSDLAPSRVLERPKVIYNATTGKYVMWMHIDDPLYDTAKVGVATASSATGPFTYRGSFRPLGLDSRDMTLFQDTDGKAYLVFATDRGSSLRIARLSNDYLSLTGENVKPFTTSEKREAPALFKANGKYFLITSGATYWKPNAAKYAIADSVMGAYKIIGNPAYAADAATTYHSQSTYVQQVYGKTNAYIFMGDQWNETNLSDSRYMWSPLWVINNELWLNPPAVWDLSWFR